MHDDRLYRGQSMKYRFKPFVPSAFRGRCIKYMENKLTQCGIDTQQYKQKCIPNKILEQYCNCDYQPPRKAFYAYWLSLVNCALAINENPVCLKFCQSYPFTKNFDKDKVGMYGLLPERVAEVGFSYAKDLFDSDKENETFHLQLLLHDYAFFQHINHAFSKLNKNISVFFPTLVLDWTWDKSIAERFADTDGEKGTILSISWEAYNKWKPFRNRNVYHLYTDESRVSTFGFESYKTIPPWNKYDWYSYDNNLMVEQVGAVIFWPWEYTIDQLKENSLGKVFDFVEVSR